MNALICGLDNYIVIVCYQSVLIERKSFTVTNDVFVEFVFDVLMVLV